MSTVELIERLRTARIDDRVLAEARRLLGDGGRLAADRGLSPTEGLATVLKDYRLAAAVVEAADRVAKATGRRPRLVRERTCLARLFSSCTLFDTLTVAENSRVFRTPGPCASLETNAATSIWRRCHAKTPGFQRSDALNKYGESGCCRWPSDDAAASPRRNLPLLPSVRGRPADPGCQAPGGIGFRHYFKPERGQNFGEEDSPGVIQDRQRNSHQQPHARRRPPLSHVLPTRKLMVPLSHQRSASCACKAL
jgi:hypothetical protein